MTTTERRRRLRCAWLPATAACLASRVAAGADAADTATPADRDWRLESPGAYTDLKDGVWLATHGVVARRDDLYLLADAVRYELPWRNGGDQLWASGHVVLVRPGVRIEASMLGFKRLARDGEAWDAVVEVNARGHTIRARAEHLLISPQLLELDHARLDFGYGGILGIACPVMRIALPEKPRARTGQDPHAEAKAEVDSVTFRHPTVSVLGVPVLWSPVLYRDFRYDEPWSRWMFGSSKRLGDFLHVWVGMNLPVADGWRTRVEARGDDNTRSGDGFGGTFSWEHDAWGSGRVEMFEMPKETVAGGTNDDTNVATRRAQLVDAEHRTDLGAGLLSLRYVEEPAPDPLAPGFPAPLGGGDERFRADYFSDDLDTRPFARKGGGLAYGFDWGTVVVDSERNPRPEWTQTERWASLRLQSVPLEVAGPLHTTVSAWEEDLHQVWADTSAERFRGDAAIGFLEWAPDGIGVDGSVGARDLRYDQGRILGVDQPGDQERHVGYLSAGVRLRLEDDGAGWMHVFTPRLGVEVTSPGFGDFLPGYGFGDAGDTLEEDQRYYTLGFETAYTSGPRQLRASVTSRWAMRDQDRVFVDPTTGLAYKGSTRFADISATAEGQLGRRISVTGLATYDDRPRRFTALNAGLSLVVTDRLSLRDSVALNTSLIGQPVAPPDNIANSPGFTYNAGRYRLDGSLTITPGGRPIDAYLLQLGRQMVDGELSLSYEIDYNQQGQLYDQRFGIGFSLFSNPQQAGPIGHGQSYSVR